jgi:hypothetical protein
MAVSELDAPAFSEALRAHSKQQEEARKSLAEKGDAINASLVTQVLEAARQGAALRSKVGGLALSMLGLQSAFSPFL